MRSTAQYEQRQKYFLPRSPTALIVVALALGSILRFANLDKKIYWFDEFETSYRIAGYSNADLGRVLSPGREIEVRDIQKFQRINPATGLREVIRSLAINVPQHPPFYFVLARLWANVFGDSPKAIRVLSAFLAVLVIPGVYWFGRELFDSSETAVLAMMLLAISPFQVLYAQEARPYSLWMLMTVISSAALLRAIRLETWPAWGLYALTLIAGIYSHLLFALVIVGHGVYMLASKKNALEKPWPYFVASILALAFFLPWLRFIFLHFAEAQGTTSWIRASTAAPLDRLLRWSLVFSSGLIDTGGTAVLKATYDLDTSWIHLIRLPVLLLIGYSLVFICKKAPRRTSLFVFALTGSSVLPLLVPDLAWRWQGSAHPRFLTPFYLATLLSVAYLLGTKMLSPSISERVRWRAVTAVTFFSAILSCLAISYADTWWNKGQVNPRAASLINQTTQPLLIVSFEWPSLFHLLSLSNSLDPNVSVRLTEQSKIPTIPEKLENVFLLNPSENLRQILEQSNYRLEAAPARPLWRLIKKHNV
jgi:uncharacterized membrane protein